MEEIKRHCPYYLPCGLCTLYNEKCSAVGRFNVYPTDNPIPITIVKLEPSIEATTICGNDNNVAFVGKGRKKILNG